MMLDSTKVDALVERLLTKTRDGELRWKRGVRLDSFQTDFPEYSVIVYGLGGRGLAQDSPGVFALSVFDGRGEPVLSLPDNSAAAGSGRTTEAADQERLRGLYDVARRAASPPEKALDALLAELA